MANRAELYTPANVAFRERAEREGAFVGRQEIHYVFLHEKLHSIWDELKVGGLPEDVPPDLAEHFVRILLELQDVDDPFLLGLAVEIDSLVWKWYAKDPQSPGHFDRMYETTMMVLKKVTEYLKEGQFHEALLVAYETDSTLTSRYCRMYLKYYGYEDPVPEVKKAIKEGRFNDAKNAIGTFPEELTLLKDKLYLHLFDHSYQKENYHYCIELLPLMQNPTIFTRCMDLLKGMVLQLTIYGQLAQVIDAQHLQMLLQELKDRMEVGQIVAYLPIAV